VLFWLCVDELLEGGLLVFGPVCVLFVGSFFEGVEEWQGEVLVV
jgi:hypothetical protein